MNTSRKAISGFGLLLLVSSGAFAQGVPSAGAMAAGNMAAQIPGLMNTQAQAPMAQPGAMANPQLMNNNNPAMNYNQPAYNNGYQMAPNYNAAGASMASPQMNNVAGVNSPTGEVNNMNPATNEICRCINEQGLKNCERLMGQSNDRDNRDTRRHGS